MTNILVAVQRIAPVADVLVGGSQNLIASGVWAGVRFCIEVGQIMVPAGDSGGYRAKISDN